MSCILSSSPHHLHNVSNVILRRYNQIHIMSKFRAKYTGCAASTCYDLLVVPALWQDGYGATLGEQPPEDAVGAFLCYLVLMGAAETQGCFLQMR